MVLGGEKILGERIYVRPLTPEDASLEYCTWLNDPEVNYYLETRKATLEEVRAYIQKQIDNPNSIFFGIFDKGTDKHIGNIKLEPIDWGKKKTVFGILIGDKAYWGKGIGTEATKLAVDIAFGSLGMEEVELGVIGENKRAQRVFEKAGFRAVELQKKAMNHDGMLFDKIIMRIQKGQKMYAGKNS